MSLKKVIELAQRELGTTEYPPGSNLQKYGAEYGLNGAPWCVIFLWWLFTHADEALAFFGPGKTASCGQLLAWYKSVGQTVNAFSAQPGDILILNFHGTDDTEHCGLVTKSYDGGRYQTIEGNTSPGEEGSQDNGGCVALKTRYAYQIVGACRPQYKAEEIQATDYSGHWAEDAIQFCIDHKIMTGYPDGTFRPDQTVTRGELAEVMWRIKK